jgi:hypothetical protein
MKDLSGTTEKQRWEMVLRDVGNGLAEAVEWDAANPGYNHYGETVDHWNALASGLERAVKAGMK